MKMAVVSYSLSGNNQMVAQKVAAGLGIEHIQLKEGRKRRALNTLVDIIFNRTPRVSPEPDVLAGYDFILLFAPVWMGHIATPLRSYLKYIGEQRKQYGLIAVCGGVNRNLKAKVTGYAGVEPAVLMELAIMIELGVKTPFYRLNSAEAERLADKVLAGLRGHFKL
ncbi:MAG: hypothetical protein N2248_01935 [candidate division WOR-3 bacterium]|uniref:Flavodoxin family protein n=1 Tax=candidate division WOR-3 bacterium TaxID=2052148 RepID=A0A7C1SP37_UNCW3|nr:hypothetical protein [candidate division WOR-3 bacterium]